MSVFLTSTAHSIGNQLTSFSGVEEADVICNTLAAGSNMVSGLYVAWLSSGRDSAPQRIGTGCWRLPNGNRVFDDEAEVVGSGPQVAIDVTETGGPVAGSGRVWTGTLSDGTVGNNCSNWDNPLASGLSGAPTIGPMWTQAIAMNDCANAYNLYCFQVRQ